MAIPWVRYGFLRSALGEGGIERTCAGILDNIRDIGIPECDEVVDALADCLEWDNAYGTARTHVSIHCVIHAVLRYVRPIALLCRSLARTQRTNVSVPVGEDAVKFGDG